MCLKNMNKNYEVLHNIWWFQKERNCKCLNRKEYNIEAAAFNISSKFIFKDLKRQNNCNQKTTDAYDLPRSLYKYSAHSKKFKYLISQRTAEAVKSTIQFIAIHETFSVCLVTHM